MITVGLRHGDHPRSCISNIAQLGAYGLYQQLKKALKQEKKKKTNHKTRLFRASPVRVIRGEGGAAEGRCGVGNSREGNPVRQERGLELRRGRMPGRGKHGWILARVAGPSPRPPPAWDGVTEPPAGSPLPSAGDSAALLTHETKHKWWRWGCGEVGREPCVYVLNYFSS